MPELRRRWRPPFPLDLPAVLAPLQRGKGDPAVRRDADGLAWLAGNTPDGPGTLALRRADGEVEAAAWGDGAAFLLDRLPALLGAGDDDTGFVAHHDVVARVRWRMPGLRIGASGRVWDALVPAVLEQKVTGVEARRSWRELCRWFGEPAPGPAPAGLRVPPTPAAIRSVVDWDWHRAGVDLKRRTTLVAAARVARRLERAAELGGTAGRRLLRQVPGVGVWTAAEVAQRAWGDPDAVSVGDFHIPAIVGHALVGSALDDAGMLAELAPYAPQRQRVVRYLEAAGFTRPRFGPRYPVRDYRAV
ncbi:3-methyladenine DNA glycosylase/8-oxoguanine DNA glycosylase [Amycolatopsis arida]|uniref:3-methyladenine DNA glycosylase/8-oxoguanine DNA glycosylase n=1 Tax=Amycolatopsis arida TaxID=587909 RepID=A0A1I5WKM6_9PSEU|nr:DNA-3-methyladenine glycosylase [Amycolatopsis arida]TDX92326.1 3-methyladenine DNA glycosylase/8-oxoguanine DNA glycosylase [Amycolatopsis arida]SFQ20117.1 3-methyladenine DNA glycosylase/8-oxoguanine DNA glycosylase [Amycolatopsis arida]